MSQLVIGVDPGASGALAALDVDNTLVALIDMPQSDGQVSAPLIADWLRELRLDHEIITAWVEKVGSMPGQGVSSTFKFGRAYGTVTGVLGGVRVPTEYVPPSKWKSDAGLTGKDKDASRLLAIELWPTRSASLARKKDHGRAEAALIARYGLSQRENRGAT